MLRVRKSHWSGQTVVLYDFKIVETQIPVTDMYGVLMYYENRYICVDEVSQETLLDNNGKGYSTVSNARRGLKRYLKRLSDKIRISKGKK